MSYQIEIRRRKSLRKCGTKFNGHEINLVRQCLSHGKETDPFLEFEGETLMRQI